MALGAERCTLELYLVVAHVSPVGEGDAILHPRLTEHALGHNALGVLALVVLVALALGLEVSSGALIDHVAHFHDSALYVVRGTEAEGSIAAALAGSAGHAAYSGEGGDVHVLHLDRIKQAGPREAEDVIVGVSVGVVGVGEDEVSGEVFHRGSLLSLIDKSIVHPPCEGIVEETRLHILHTIAHN